MKQKLIELGFGLHQCHYGEGKGQMVWSIILLTLWLLKVEILGKSSLLATSQVLNNKKHLLPSIKSFLCSAYKYGLVILNGSWPNVSVHVGSDICSHNCFISHSGDNRRLFTLRICCANGNTSRQWNGHIPGENAVKKIHGSLISVQVEV